jgi:hypothetical protein
MTAVSSYAADSAEWIKDYHQRLLAGIAKRPAPEGEQASEGPMHAGLTLFPDQGK